MIHCEWIRVFLAVLCIIAIVVAGYQDRVRREPEVERKEKRLLYSRKFTWLKQLCCSVLFIINSYVLIQSLSKPFTVSSLVYDIAVEISLSLCIYLDCVPAISYPIAWCFVYGILSLYEAFSYVAEPEYIHFMGFLVSAAPLVITVLGEARYEVQQYPPTAEYTCTILEYFSFSYLNGILIQPGLKKGSLTMDEVPGFYDKDMTEINCQEINRLLNTSPNKNISSPNNLHLAWYLFLLVKDEWLKVACFQLLSSTCIFLSPLALEKIMIYVKYQGSEEYISEGFLQHITIWVVVMLLFVATALQGVGDGQHYTHGRHVGVRVRAALIGLVYTKAFTIDFATANQSIGKLNNLISVDVNAVFDFCCYSQYIWSLAYEIMIASIMLYLVLGYAALVGIALMIVSIWIGFIVGQRLQEYKSKMLKAKDARMELMNEVLSSIRIIKYFAWEMKFQHMITAARMKELSHLMNYSLTNAVLSLVWNISPIFVSLIAFLSYKYLFGQTLSVSSGFTALTLFAMLRYPLVAFSEMLNYLIGAKTSLNRIEEFLVSPNLPGLPQLDSSTRKFSSSGTKREKEVFIRAGIFRSQYAYKDSGLVKQKKDTPQAIIRLKNVTMAWRSIDHSDNTQFAIENKNHDSIWDTVVCQRYATEKNCFTNCFSRPNFNSSDVDNSSHPMLVRSNTASDDSESSLADLDDKYEVDMELCNIQSRSSKLSSPYAALPVTEKVVSTATSTTSSEIMFKTPSYRIILQDITVDIPSKQLTVIVGATGAGKSSFLQGILLGESILLNEQSGTGSSDTAFGGRKKSVRECHGRISYSAQSAWIQNATLRENILFGQAYDERRYEAVLFACALTTDLALLPAGDQTEIGEKGVNLSGGQQQRVSLARAAYAESDIILLDDPLSAVDAHVGEHIFRHLICGFLSDRTRLLVTHNLSLVLPSADNLLCVDSGMRSFIAQGTPAEAVQQLSHTIGYDSGITGNGSLLCSIVGALKKGLESDRLSKDSNDEIVETMLSQSKESIDCSIGHVSSIEDVLYDGLTQEETKVEGNVSWSTYWYYMQSAGGISFVALFICLSLWISIALLLQNYCLSLWLLDIQSNASGSTRALQYYLLSIVAVIIGYIGRSVLEIVGTICASQRLHDKLVHSVLLASTSWFDKTPLGRIVNRFSQDIANLDSSVMSSLVSFTDLAIGTIQIFAVIFYFLPSLLLVFIPVIFYILWITSQYFKISRELKQLESISKSPFFSLCSETFSGLTTIRAFQKESQLFDTCCHRVNDMNRCHFYLYLCNKWLCFRMQACSSLIIGAVAVGIVYFIETQRSSTTAIVAGLTLLYSLQLSETMTMAIRTFADSQMEMNSVERIQEFIKDVPSEAYVPQNVSSEINQKWANALSLTDMSFLQLYVNVMSNDSSYSNTDEILKPSNIWPSKGEVKFENISMSYKTSPRPILNNISFIVTAGCKIGVVGRTGAGKSSLIVALFRMVEPSQGRIVIDGQDILQLPLQYLRQHIAIVPQEPTLFAGSLRFNMDPFQQYSDDEIWWALERVRLAEYCESLLEHQRKTEASSLNTIISPLKVTREMNNNKLSRPIMHADGELEKILIAEKGGNFSVGQRQLLCMARALLRRAKVLILDECTASVDHETDAVIQEIIRHELSSTTVLCIAHRLNTVVYYDKVLVMEKGSVKEYDSPLRLMEKEESVFAKMCQATGSFELLHQIAKEHFVQS